MDARALLDAVAETYAKLSSFEIEIQLTNESGDEETFNRHTQRARAYFVAPDKIRIDPSGPNGTITVTDGKDHHRYFRRPKHYSTWAVEPGHPISGFFRSDYPLNSGLVFLFNQIAQNVTGAEILRDEPDVRIVSVNYAPAPRPGFIVSSSPITFWIDTPTNLISRMEGEVTHRPPRADELLRTKTVCAYTNPFIDQTIPPQTFEYAPPADAIGNSDQRRRGGCGTSRRGPDGFETWHSADWQDKTLVDNFELKIRDIELNFERRLTFVGNDLKISEKVTGPQGASKHEFSIKVGE